MQKQLMRLGCLTQGRAYGWGSRIAEGAVFSPSALHENMPSTCSCLSWLSSASSFLTNCSKSLCLTLHLFTCTLVNSTTQQTQRSMFWILFCIAKYIQIPCLCKRAKEVQSRSPKLRAIWLQKQRERRSVYFASFGCSWRVVFSSCAGEIWPLQNGEWT